MTLFFQNTSFSHTIGMLSLDVKPTARTIPSEGNGVFDARVVSRQHAEIWEEGNQIFIKDLKSTNGTFVNGERLSPEGIESDPYQLKSGDIVEMGIDIVGDDNETIIHRRVAARAACIFSENLKEMCKL
ncbi:SMAD/FHA domain-containing protein [Gymnopus androsaceus JB14]|uniref:SMAD/FHA domain-containing protein n=1 Tax=Gymnopus androsaceus JB14 TaxID=1447944 RepID=A0A6A4HGW2_9AGAR|nr:SMAD/FHA domain-containing protein [Gymnopus androsaceus JB14]